MKHGRNPNTSARPFQFGNDPDGGFSRAIVDGSTPALPRSLAKQRMRYASPFPWLRGKPLAY